MVYLDKLNEIIKKAGASPTGLKNDFSGILYLVNNQGRKSQAELCLARETAALGVKDGSIIPPDLQSYKSGFGYLAGELLYKNISRENIFLFTEEGLDFLLYEILWRHIALASAGEFGNAGDYPENQHKVRNLAVDFKKFIALVHEEGKTAKLEELAARPEFKDRHPYKDLFAALQLYRARREEFKKNKEGHCFFSPLEAYLELEAALARPESLKISAAEFNKTRTIVIEDAADMEPLFQLLVERLEAAGFRIEKTSSGDLRPVVSDGGLELKGLITSLDEAEYVGWRIKKLLDEGKDKETGVKEGEISVTCFSRETGSLLPLVFTRYGLQAVSPALAGSSPVFRVFSAAVKIALGRASGEKEYFELFNSPVSNFRLEKCRLSTEVENTDHKSLQDLLREAAYKASVNRETGDPAHWVGKVLTELPPGLLNQKEQDHVANLLGLPKFAAENPDCIFSDLLAASVDLAEVDDARFIKTLGRMAKRANAAFKDCAGTKDEKDLLVTSLLLLMSGAEYYPRGKEVTDTYVVPVTSPDCILNTSASHVFACGLTGEADKLRKLPIPEKLAAELGLTDSGRTYPEKLRAETYSRFAALAELGKAKTLSVVLTYGYNNIGGDMAGMSNLVRAAKAHYPGLSDTKAGSLPSLYVSHELMLENNGASPDASYGLKGATPAPAPGAGAVVELNDFPAKAGDFSLLALLRQRQKNHEQKSPAPLGKDGLPLIIKIGVRDFASFINCPRKFIVKMFLAAAGIKEEAEFEDQIPRRKGSFWHRVYEYAGAEAGFYSVDPVRIKACLQTGLQKLLAEPGQDPETFQDRPLAEFNQECARKFELFAKNEVDRQTRLAGLKGLKQEAWLSRSIGEVPVSAAPDAEKVKIIIHGKVDRLDLRDGGSPWLHIWDYKTGQKKKLSFGEKGNTSGQFSADSENALQLALYAYMLETDKEQLGLADKTVAGQVTGLNIFNDGSLKFDGDYAANAASLNLMVKKIVSQGIPAFLKLLEAGALSALDVDYSPAVQKNLPAADPAIKPLYNPDCSKYCNTHLCKFISLSGLKGGCNAY